MLLRQPKQPNEIRIVIKKVSVSRPGPSRLLSIIANVKCPRSVGVVTIKRNRGVSRNAKCGLVVAYIRSVAYVKYHEDDREGHSRSFYALFSTEDWHLDDRTWPHSNGSGVLARHSGNMIIAL